MESFRAVLFDMDGTLLDTLADIGNSVNRVLSVNGFPIHPLESYQYFVGDGSSILIEKALPPKYRNPETIAHCLKAYQEDYGRNWRTDTHLYEGISELLDGLVEAGLRMSILSNKYHQFTVQCAEAFLNRWPFDVVFGIRNRVPKKPDPAGAIEISTILNIPPAEFLYVGDTSVDMQTAVSAGMFPVGVLWGFRLKDELVSSGAKMIISHPQELLKMIH